MFNYAGIPIRRGKKGGQCRIKALVALRHISAFFFNGLQPEGGGHFA